MMFHPLPTLAVVTIMSIIWSVICMFRHWQKWQKTTFALSSLSFVSLLNVMAYLTGFTVGRLLVISALFAGLLLASLVKQYKIEILVSSVVSLLLLLDMQGIGFSRTIIVAILGVMAIREGWNLKNWRECNEIALPSARMLAYLFGISLLLPSEYSPFLSFVLSGIGGVLVIRTKQYRWQIGVISIGSILWLFNTTVYLHK